MEGVIARADDIVLAIFRMIKEWHKKDLSANRELLHLAFYALRQQHRTALAELRFRYKGMFPESPVLDQAIANLEGCGLLHRKNESPRFYSVDPALDLAFTKFVRPRLQEAGVGDDVLKQMADELCERLSAGASA